jgi:hypothetical protein
MRLTVNAPKVRANRRKLRLAPGFGLAVTVVAVSVRATRVGGCAATTVAHSPATSRVLIRKKECIASSLELARKKGVAPTGPLE